MAVQYLPQLIYCDGAVTGLLPFMSACFSSPEEANLAAEEFMKENSKDETMSKVIGYSILKIITK